MQPAEHDPFDYKLRGKEEVKQEFKYFMPKFMISVAYKGYPAGDTRQGPENLDNRDRVVIIYILPNSYINLGKGICASEPDESGALAKTAFCLPAGP